MPAKSKAQAKLMAAAEHGAQFPMARSIRASMTQPQMHDYAATPQKNLPAHVKPTGQPQKAAGHPHKNLGGYLHAPKKGKA